VHTFLVERYWPGVASERLLEALDRGRHVIERMNDEGTSVRETAASSSQRGGGLLRVRGTLGPPQSVSSTSVPTFRSAASSMRSP
jgi:hypothetical protein